MSWDIASLLAKVITLMAMASVVGGVLCLYLCLQSDSQVRGFLFAYLKIGAVTGVLASCLYFFVQVGAFSQSGLSGMLDITMLSILSQSALGYASLSRVLAFALVLYFTCYMQRANKREELGFGYYSVLILFMLGLLLAYSFTLIGHVAELNLIGGFAIGLHVLGISLWIGSLYPLLYLCKAEEVIRLQKIMQRFGELAMVFVAVLVLSGVFLLTQLLESPVELISTSYGLTLLFKLAGVTVLLTLGALNKLRLVPGLSNDAGVTSLRQSIKWELGFAFLVLMITAYLTTLVGMNHAG